MSPWLWAKINNLEILCKPSCCTRGQRPGFMTSKMVHHMQNNKTSPQACHLFWSWAGFGISPLIEVNAHLLKPPCPNNLSLSESGPAEMMGKSNEHKLNNNQMWGHILPLGGKEASLKDRHQFFSFRGAERWSTKKPCSFKKWIGVYTSQVRVHPNIPSTQGKRCTFLGGRCDESQGQVEWGWGINQHEGVLPSPTPSRLLPKLGEHDARHR